MTHHQRNPHWSDLPRFLRAWLGIGVGLGIVCMPVASVAQGQWVILDRTLHEHRVELSLLERDSLLAIDQAGQTQRFGTDSILLLTHEQQIQDAPPRDPPWMTRQLTMFGEDTPKPQNEPVFASSLELADGQHWVGLLSEASGQSLSWQLFDSINLSVSLDAIRAILLRPFEPGARQSWPGLDDRIVLANNDTIDGFVASIADPIPIESDTRTESIPLARVAGVLLANPAKNAKGMRIWTDDGSVVVIDSVEITSSGRVKLTFAKDADPEQQTRSSESTPTAQAVNLRQENVQSVLFDAAALTGLAQLSPTAIAYPPLRAWQSPPRADRTEPMGLGDIDLVGPVRVTWTLPRRASRFAADASLPPANWAWGDCELVVRTESGHELFRSRLNAASPSVRLNVPLDGARALTIEVEAGQSGAIQDGVVLHQPTLLWE